MEINAGIVRTKDEMEEGLELLQDLKKRGEKVRVEGNRQYNPAWHYALDLKNLLCVAEAITLAAHTPQPPDIGRNRLAARRPQIRALHVAAEGGTNPGIQPIVIYSRGGPSRESVVFGAREK